MIKIGLDVGSTTLKCMVLNSDNQIIFKKYQRHFSQIIDKTAEMLTEIGEKFGHGTTVRLCISGSAGMGFAQQNEIAFIQEVFATKIAVKNQIGDADCIIELGGEDAKILFVSGLNEVRMNGSCAGGTGSFIDQMSMLLCVSPDEMNELAKDCTKIYSIASRCGVFAKSDIQPLINQGAKKEDISASIFAAVVNQTISGLAQGREICGKVVYLGGPLTFLSQLRASFDKTLNLNGICPENSLYFVALGAAMQCNDKDYDIFELIEKIKSHSVSGEYLGCKPLFENEEQYIEFQRRHFEFDEDKHFELGTDKHAYIGIDAGSTTVKAVVINENEDVVYSLYMPNNGNPVPKIKAFLEAVYEKYPDIRIMSSASTGYGEEIIKNAFHIDFGIVETIAHFTAAKKYSPDVDFIIDIGGQDIKCFKIHNGAIDNIFLNEACSSGCGSFLQTFAGALGYSVEEFAKIGLLAKKPVDLGSRCTVFMNSSVKQAQKDGATVDNISAGLSLSVVKNALYKVIRVNEGESLGNNIVVQGGTFMNDAVLRAFEQEIGSNVIRPKNSGTMGAYGAAIYAKHNAGPSGSSILTKEQLETFTHDVTAITCKGCTNRCKLTINTFDGGRKYIGGNQCEKPTENKTVKETYSMYDFKRELISQYQSFDGKREKIGLALGLNMFELLPFWYTLFKNLGFGVEVSPNSSKKLYLSGQNSIPSDTVCYPAKLMHGHVQSLIDAGVKTIFYPCMSYNFDEHLGDNHYNCPVVAYYPEVIYANMKSVKNINFIKDYIGIHRRGDFTKKFTQILQNNFDGISSHEAKKAIDCAYDEYSRFQQSIRTKGEELLKIADEKNLPIIVVVGRPYHIDREINHGIDKYICDNGAVLISEDALGNRYHKIKLGVLNQWTYHSRMYAAADFVASNDNPNINLVQLVSFGCGVDAVTTDEIRSIIESKNKIYTQIKIDEITNLGAVKIRLRSLFATVKQKGEQRNAK